MEYGAIDLHTKASQVRIVTEDGQVVKDGRIATRPETLTAWFAGRAAMRVLLEAGTESTWVAERLEAAGHTVIVADPNYAPMYGERTRRIKTDKRDVAALADANRRGLYRPAHRVSPAQRAVRQQVQVREALVRTRTQTINVIRTQLRSAGYRVASGQAETCARRVRALALPPTLLARLTPLLSVLDTLGPLLTTADETIEQIAQADPITVRLMTAPGVGPVTSVQVRAALDDIGRFAHAGAVAAYLGLVPRERSSGERQHRGGITKAGSSSARAALVQACWTIWRQQTGPAAPLSAWAHQLATRRGRKIAIVALARRLARVLYAMWRDGQPFDATRTARRLPAVA